MPPFIPFLKKVAGGVGPKVGAPHDMQSGAAAANKAAQSQFQKQYPSFGQALAGGLAGGNKPGSALMGALTRPKAPKAKPLGDQSTGRMI